VGRREPLIKVEPGGTPQNGQYKAEYKYDWQGRRIEKQVWSYSGGWTATEDWKFMYSDWLLLLELDGLNSDSVKRQYTWGLDLSGVASGAPAGRLTGGGLPGVLTGAGGIGGLLSVHDSAGPVSYVYFADVQGNISQVVDVAAGSAGASMMAKYVYDAYGNRTWTAGTYTQPFGFSTKFYDGESGFVCFGYRYYSAVLGRWISRDPLDEPACANLQAFCRNASPNSVDPLGLTEVSGGPASPSTAPVDPYDKCLENCDKKYKACMKARLNAIAGTADELLIACSEHHSPFSIGYWQCVYDLSGLVFEHFFPDERDCSDRRKDCRDDCWGEFECTIC
jgi:RHS repeat-associated protein